MLQVEDLTGSEVTHQQEVTEEVGGKHFSQAVGGDAVLLRQDPLAGGKHGDHTTATNTQNKPKSKLLFSLYNETFLQV